MSDAKANEVMAREISEIAKEAAERMLNRTNSNPDIINTFTQMLEMFNRMSKVGDMTEPMPEEEIHALTLYFMKTAKDLERNWEVIKAELKELQAKNQL